MSNQIKHRKLGTEPIVGLYYGSECVKCGWVGSSGELTEDDAQCLQPVADDYCWGDTDEIDAERLLELLQAGAFDKPAAQNQDSLVYMVRSHGSCCWEEISGESLKMCQVQTTEYEVRKLFAEQPAPVAVVLPERSSQDYAIEHAEYMAQSADDVLAKFQAYGLALLAVDEGGDDGEGELFEATDTARGDLQESLVDLRGMVYEFRKRSSRCTSL